MTVLSKESLLETITQHLAYEHRTWPKFLIQDCKDFIEQLHSYRLHHLLQNIEQFIAHIETLCEDFATMNDEGLGENHTQTTIQALFLLSCVEFASASQERMMIRDFEQYAT